MLLPGREWQEGYRFAFNGKEQDPEQLGQGNIFDYGFRIYNPRLGKFLSVDPLTMSYPWYTPYQFAGNTPIWAIDVDGLEDKKTNDGGVDPNKPNEDFKDRAEATYNKGKEEFARAQSSEERIKIAENTANEMITLASEAGFNLAADHLWHYLHGDGTTCSDDWALLQDYDALKDAIALNKGRLQKGAYGYYNNDPTHSQIGLKETAKSLEDGETYSYTSATWETLVYFPEGTDAYYAYGTATLETHGSFTLIRIGNNVTVSGTITNELVDRYDWDQGKITQFFNRVLVQDEQMSYLETNGSAHSYNMGAIDSYPISITIKLK